MTDDRMFYGQKRNFPITSPIQLKKMFPDLILNLSNLAEHSYTKSKISEELIPLESLLLSFGGTRVCMPNMEEDFEKIMERGQLWLGDKAVFKKGKPSQCHMNSALLWEANKDKTRICTGYALSSDGVWRQHSWCIWAKPRVNKIVETTVSRLLYFGFVMNEEECEEFLSWY